MKIKFKLKLIFIFFIMLILMVKYMLPILTLEEIEENSEVFLD